MRRNAESLTAAKFHDSVAVALLDAPPNEVLPPVKIPRQMQNCRDTKVVFNFGDASSLAG